jgi:hypothetical protein
MFALNVHVDLNYTFQWVYWKRNKCLKIKNMTYNNLVLPHPGGQWMWESHAVVGVTDSRPPGQTGEPMQQIVPAVRVGMHTLPGGHVCAPSWQYCNC